MPSPFFAIPASDWVASNPLAFAIRDRYPVTRGHTLVITKRLVATWFDATREEQAAILELVDAVKRELDVSLHPDGYNVGFNSGEAAGQTVPHLHVHVIPRYRGDMPDPRGGVRHVIPWKGNYKRDVAPPLATGGSDPFIAHLRPLFARARSVAIVAAFVQESGLDSLRLPIFGALGRGAHVQLLTGDYLNITQADALARLVDWASAKPWSSDENAAGSLEARIVEVARLERTLRSFHPKSWRFEGADFGVAFVGSSNVSRGALGEAIEWNLRTDRERDPQGYERIVRAFQDLWAKATPLTSEWVADYAQRARATALPPLPGEVELDTPEPPPEPTDVQREALAALTRSREEDRKRALVVLATGLGKTWLAAFDVEAFGLARKKTPRVLFLAHRAELLDQAARTFRKMFRRSFPEARVSWFVADEGDLEGDLVLASVQKLSRPENLARLAGRPFDYVIVDEVHHAAAPSYREILSRVDPAFFLGLTATPDRSDEGDVLGIFDDHVAYRADLGAGVERGLLVPFAYHGLKDDVDYANIPWRNRRFDPGELARAVQTRARMERLWKAWQEHPASRTLVFCCSIEHARFARDWLSERGVKVAVVHSGEDSDDRDASLRALDEGSLEALCAVDIFNEGVDVPRIDRVVMLRPTESSVIFLRSTASATVPRRCKGGTGAGSSSSRARVTSPTPRSASSPRPVSG